MGDGFQPKFKANLWKLKSGGNKLDEAHWFLREMWVTKNGHLVYFSKKENKNLVYYNPDDLAGATYALVAEQKTCKPWSFTVQLCTTDDDEAPPPGEFAAETAALRKKWMKELQKMKRRRGSSIKETLEGLSTS